MFSGLADWWDGVELWLAQLSFPLQFLLVMAVLVPLCLVAAWLIDKVVDKVVGKLAGWLDAARDSGRPS